MIYQLIGFMHKLLKIVKTNKKRKILVFYTYSNPCETFFYGENFITYENLKYKIRNETYKIADNATAKNHLEAWLSLINSSIVPFGWSNSDLHNTAYSSKRKQIQLSSWIWTSAAICRYYYTINDTENVLRISDKFIKLQLPDGGWIVRTDIINGIPIKIIAPNDSAYIAANSIIKAYKMTKDNRYLSSAEKCAEWIMKTSRDDGLVYIGFNLKSNSWIKDVNIVDIGFTLSLFSELFKITTKDVYYDFAMKFANTYINLFYNEDNGLLSSSIDSNDLRFGGYFARGQGWALEGLISLYDVFNSSHLYRIIESIVGKLINSQFANGSWPYNISRILYGIDNKGVSIVAYNILKWYLITKEVKYLQSAMLAFEWCKKNTILEGSGKGYIMDYSIEGSISYDLYSKVGMTYSTSYALEIGNILKELL